MRKGAGVECSFTLAERIRIILDDFGQEARCYSVSERVEN